MKNKKKIGIIGGVGPQATNYIYKKIIEFSQEKYGAKNNDDYPYLIFESLPIPDFISNKKHLDQAKKILVKSVKILEKAGATKLAIASNTVHILIDELKAQTKIDFLSVIEIVSKKVAERSLKKVGILGSPVLIKSKLYQKELAKHDIKVILPKDEGQTVSELIIRQVLAGKNNGTVKKKYVDLIQSLFNRQAQAIILACTELPLAINYEALGNKTINSDELLAEAIVDYYYTA